MMPRDVIPQPRWYAVICAIGAARLLKLRFEGSEKYNIAARPVEGVPVRIPVREKRSYRRGKVHTHQEALLGRYILARMTIDRKTDQNEDWARLKAVKGIVRLLDLGGELIPIPDEEVEVLSRLENTKGVIPAEAADSLFSAGQSVGVTGGAFAGRAGRVLGLQTRLESAVDWQGSVGKQQIHIARVELEILGRLVRTEIREQHLEPA